MNDKIRTVFLVVGYVLFLVIPNAFADAGDLDMSFGIDGRVTTDLGLPDEAAFALAIQPDGKIVAAGFTTPDYPDDADFALARYNTDGSLDGDFGTTGKVITDFGGSEQIWAIALQNDGKIVVAGPTFAGPPYPSVLARYDSHGNLDNGFDGDGKLTTDSSSFAVHALAIQSDGKIIAGGTDRTDGLVLALARYNADGSPDSTFDGDGSVLVDLPGYYATIEAIGIQEDGRIVTAGKLSEDPVVPGSDFLVARFNPDGSLDTFFGSGQGWVVTDLGGDGDEAFDLAIQPDGKIVVVGSGSSSKFAMARYDADGSLDESFGIDGKLTHGDSYTATAVAIQPDGKLIVASHLDSIYRFTPDGTIDTDFGDLGLTRTFFPHPTDNATFLGSFSFTDMKIQSNGEIVAVGGNGNFVLARFHATAEDEESPEPPAAGGCHLLSR